GRVNEPMPAAANEAANRPAHVRLTTCAGIVCGRLKHLVVVLLHNGGLRYRKSALRFWSTHHPRCSSFLKLRISVCFSRPNTVSIRCAAVSGPSTGEI